jgi:hypothetical protein
MYLIPEQTCVIHVFVSDAALKWVRVVTGERLKLLAQLRQKLVRNKNSENMKSKV